MLGPNIRLHFEEFNNIKTIITNIRNNIEQANNIVSNLVFESKLYEDINGTVPDFVLEKLSSVYNDLLNINENTYIITDELFRYINIYKAFCKETKNVNNLNNDYRKVITIDWFLYLFHLYERYNGSYPVDCLNFIEYLKTKYNEMINSEQDELVNIIDIHLGGLGCKSTLDVSKNLEDWIKKNFDCTCNVIKDKIKFVSIVEV
jgi:hypothetical protein